MLLESAVSESSRVADRAFSFRKNFDREKSRMGLPFHNHGNQPFSVSLGGDIIHLNPLRVRFVEFDSPSHLALDSHAPCFIFGNNRIK